MTTCSASISNRKGLCHALDIVERKVLELENRAKNRISIEKKSIDETGTKIANEANKSAFSAREKEMEKKKVVSVLLNKRNCKANPQLKLKKMTKRNKKEIKCSPGVDMENRRKSKQNTLNYRKTQKNREDEFHYANPTMSFKLRGGLSKKDKIEKADLNPFFAVAGQNKSHNVRVIIQQNLMKQKLLPLKKRGNIDEEISREDIDQALFNIEKEIDFIRNYQKAGNS